MASATQKDLDICEVAQDVLDKYRKFRFRRKENPAAMICMQVMPGCPFSRKEHFEELQLQLRFVIYLTPKVICS
jgi:hypothetical protein